MASTYVNDLRLNEMATGDQSGAWGTVTNLNLEMIAEAFAYGTEAIANASTHTITVPDGARVMNEGSISNAQVAVRLAQSRLHPTLFQKFG